MTLCRDRDGEVHGRGMDGTGHVVGAWGRPGRRGPTLAGLEGSAGGPLEIGRSRLCLGDAFFANHQDMLGTRRLVIDKGNGLPLFDGHVRLFEIVGTHRDDVASSRCRMTLYLTAAQEHEDQAQDTEGEHLLHREAIFSGDRGQPNASAQGGWVSKKRSSRWFLLDSSGKASTRTSC